jgi:hypothetical protein
MWLQPNVHTLHSAVSRGSRQLSFSARAFACRIVASKQPLALVLRETVWILFTAFDLPFIAVTWKILGFDSTELLAMAALYIAMVTERLRAMEIDRWVCVSAELYSPCLSYLFVTMEDWSSHGCVDRQLLL